MLLALILACASAQSATTPSAPSPEPAPAPEVTPEPVPAEITAVQYRFRDASVPPPSHRSVTVRISLESADYVVDSYGDVITEAHGPGSQELLDQAVAAYQAAGFKPAPPSDAPGCSGGTSRSVRVEQGSLIAFSGTLSKCGGSEEGLIGDMDGFAQALSALAPTPEDMLAPQPPSPGPAEGSERSEP